MGHGVESEAGVCTENGETGRVELALSANTFSRVSSISVTLVTSPHKYSLGMVHVSQVRVGRSGKTTAAPSHSAFPRTATRTFHGQRINSWK